MSSEQISHSNDIMNPPPSIGKDFGQKQKLAKKESPSIGKEFGTKR